MPIIKFLQPFDQPSGSFRLIDWLDNNFVDSRYHSFKCLVAFAKIRPFYKLHTNIQKWNSANKSSTAIIGIDHKGTSDLALQYCLANFDETYILHANHATFHPKIYLFYGNDYATIFYGSNNLTPGGLETNFEGGVLLELELNLSDDVALFNQALIGFNQLLPTTLQCTELLTPNLLNNLKSNGMLLDETTSRSKASSSTETTGTNSASTTPIFKTYNPKPARSIPKSVVLSAASSAGIVLPNVNPTPTTASTASATPSVSATTTPATIPLLINGLIIQVIPHHNGEILLSKIAINQNPTFWSYPFTGRTTPKKSSNLAYPQRIPDPIVNIYVYDNTGTLINYESNYNLNMVYYDKKAEFRITITPSILSGLKYSGGSDYPILVICNSTTTGCDYNLFFYASGSTDYANYLSICDQKLPSGGLPISRKMGWI